MAAKKEEPVDQMKDDLREAVKKRFAAVAASPGAEKKFPVGPSSAKKLGYDPRRSTSCRLA
jgi:hypothetical protein